MSTYHVHQTYVATILVLITNLTTTKKHLSSTAYPIQYKMWAHISGQLTWNFLWVVTAISLTQWHQVSMATTPCGLLVPFVAACSYISLRVCNLQCVFVGLWFTMCVCVFVIYNVCLCVCDLQCVFVCLCVVPQVGRALCSQHWLWPWEGTLRPPTEALHLNASSRREKGT